MPRAIGKSTAVWRPCAPRALIFRFRRVRERAKVNPPRHP